MKVSFAQILIVVTLFACATDNESFRHDSVAATDAESAPRLAAVFRHLDSALTQVQRDSLKAVPLHSSTDSQYQFRLSQLVTDVSVWPPSLSSGDSLAAAVSAWRISHIEDLSGAMLDAYVLHLQGTAVDMAVVSRRVPPAPRLKEFKVLKPRRDHDRAR